MSLMEMLTQHLGGDALSQIGRQLGTDEKTAGAATTAGLGALLGALTRNASKPDGAESLHRALAKDHDGGVLNNIGDLVNKPEAGPGEGILRHVLGNRRGAVEANLGKATGLDSGKSGKLLQMLAPMLMGALGKAQRGNNMDAGALAGFLGKEREQVAKATPQGMSMLDRLLDSDGDGDVDLGDLAKHGKGLLGKFLGGR